MEISEQEKAYAAGIVDGEGSICIGVDSNFYSRRDNQPYRYVYVHVLVSNTDKRIMEWLKERYGGSFHTRKQNGIGTKPIYGWEAVSNDALKFLKDIYPYLLLKKEHATWAIEFQENKIPIRHYHGKPSMADEDLELEYLFREIYYLKLKELNNS